MTDQSIGVQSSRARFYGVLCILIIAIVLGGFSPSYVGALMDGAVTPLIIHFHATVFIGWLVLFTTQALLPSFGRIDLHRKLGRFGIGYAVFLVIVGLATTANRFAFHLDVEGSDAANAFLIHPLSDMIVFPAFFTAAILYRHKPEIHKRLMLVATVMLTIAAIGRLPIGDPPSDSIALLIWLSPIYIAMIYDYVTKRIIHPAYVIGLLTLGTVHFRYLVTDLNAWQSFANGVAALVT